MNFNIIAYALYFSITAFIILRVGWLFFHYGAVYLHDLYPQRKDLADSLNRILLLGYYLLNLGYLAFSLKLWPEIPSAEAMLAMLCEKTGLICLGLGLLHFMNMGWVRLWKNANTNN